MGCMFSCYHSREKGYLCQPDFTQCFYYSVFIHIECSDRETAVFAIGAAMSAISIVYLWIIYVLFLRWKERILVAAGVMWILTIPYMLLINTTLSRMLSEPVIDVWDILSAFLLMVAAFTFFVCDYVKRKI